MYFGKLSRTIENSFLIQNSCHPEYIEGLDIFLPIVEALELTNFRSKNVKIRNGYDHLIKAVEYYNKL